MEPLTTKHFPQIRWITPQTVAKSSLIHEPLNQSQCYLDFANNEYPVFKAPKYNVLD